MKKRKRTGYPQKQNKGRINVPVLVISLILGIVSWLIGTKVYNLHAADWNRCLLIGVMFLILCGILTLGLTVTSLVTGHLDGNVLHGTRSRLQIILLVLLSYVVCFAAATALEWIYELQPQLKSSEPTSFIFVVDDSGSTLSTDPEKLRYRAIREVVDQVSPDFPYAVYSFAKDVTLLREMRPARDGLLYEERYSGGVTYMKAALTRVCDDYYSKAWDGGDRPKIILLSDGAPTDFHFFFSIKNLMRKYKRAGINISAVGYESAADDLLENIAAYTGGAYFRVNDVSGLSRALKDAAISSSERDLLSNRYMSRFSTLYGLMRILFVYVLGAGIGFAAIIAYGNFYSGKRMLKLCFLKPVAGALVMELGTVVCGMNSKLAWLVLWLFIAAQFVYNEIPEYDNTDEEEGSPKGFRDRRGNGAPIAKSIVD